jgi:hypothetical protein
MGRPNPTLWHHGTEGKKGGEGTWRPLLALHSQFGPGSGRRLNAAEARGWRTGRLAAIALARFTLLVDDLAGATLEVVGHVDSRFAHAVDG